MVEARGHEGVENYQKLRGQGSTTLVCVCGGGVCVGVCVCGCVCKGNPCIKNEESGWGGERKETHNLKKYGRTCTLMLIRSYVKHDLLL